MPVPVPEVDPWLEFKSKTQPAPIIKPELEPELGIIPLLTPEPGLSLTLEQEQQDEEPAPGPGPEPDANIPPIDILSPPLVFTFKPLTPVSAPITVEPIIITRHRGKGKRKHSHNEISPGMPVHDTRK